MGKISAYKNKISMKLITNNNEQDIPLEYIVAIIVDHNYERNIMPLVYVELNVDLNLYDDIISNASNGKMFLNVKTYDTNSTMALMEDTIKDQFVYFVPSNIQYTKELKDEQLNRNINTKSIILGLMKIDLINKNKTIFNGVYRNVDTNILINEFTSNLGEIIIDPLDNNSLMNEFILPPQDSVVKTIDYLFNYKVPFYNSKYNFFMDWNRSYLLNMNGSASKAGMNTVNFKIMQINDNEAYYQGITKELEAGTYVIFINVGDCKVSVNTTTEKNTNQLIGVNSSNISVMNLDINKSSNSINKPLFIRTESDAVTETSVKKNILEGTSVIVNFSKPNMDTSIITPDKRFIIDCYNDYDKYNGTYILTHKKEVIAKVDNNFSSTISMGFRKISNSMVVSGNKELDTITKQIGNKEYTQKRY